MNIQEAYEDIPTIESIMPYGSKCEDMDFSEQMKRDEICEEIIDDVNLLFDGFIALNFMNIAELADQR